MPLRGVASRVCLAIAASWLSAELARPAAAGDRQEAYAVVDAVFMQRDNLAAPRSLVIDGDTLQPSITTDDMQFPVAPGLRAIYGRREPGATGWEVGYLGVYGMFADTLAANGGPLEIAPPLSSEVASLRNASTARTTYGSVLNSAEVNFLATECIVHRPRATGYEFDGWRATTTIDWLAGFRWAGLDENASIGLADTAAGVASGYGVRASSNLFGGQIGTRGRIEWSGWAVEGWLKAALAGAALSQSQDPIVDAITGDVYRTARGSQTGTVGGIFDLGGALVYRLDEHWGLRFGYSMLWLTGVALAPDQFDFASTTTAGTAVDGNATLWLGGGTLGLECRW